MDDWISQFTEEERNIINDLARRQYQDMTPEEVDLYTRWTTAKALADAEYQERMAAIRRESEAKVENSRIESQAAISAIEAARDAAIAFYESTFDTGGDE